MAVGVLSKLARGRSSNIRVRYYSVHESTFYDKTIETWANKPSHCQSLKSYVAHGTEISPVRLLASARYVQQELPIRLARELRNLEVLPYFIMNNPHIKMVHERYLSAFRSILSIPPVKTLDEDLELLTPLLERLVRGTVNIVELMGRGIAEASERLNANNRPLTLDLHNFLDQFLISRIARRMMAQQHVMLHPQHSAQGQIGVISPNCSPLKCIINVKNIVQEICERTYGVCPEIIIKGDLDLTFLFIAPHLEYIFLEIMKNSLRATIEHHRAISGLRFPDLPPIVITICAGASVVTIKVSDQGGGISKKNLERVFEYGFTTMKKRVDSHYDGLGMLNTSVEEIHSPMAGLGFGLPLSRLYAKHFGGDLTLFTTEGYGSDLYLTLDRTGEVLENYEV